MSQVSWRWLTFGFLLLMLAVAVAADLDLIPIPLRDLYRFPGGDWVGHFGLYGILAFLAVRAFPDRANLFGQALPLAALLVFLMAVLEELSQFWFPVRTPSLPDLSFGLLGIVLGTWFAGRRK
jgi:VanZ family protein